MSDPDAASPTRLFTPLYWAAIGAGVALTLAGAAVGLLGPRLFKASRPSPASPPALTRPDAHGRGARLLIRMS